MLCIVMLLSLVIVGCGAKVTTDISSYGDTKIVVKGIGSSDITVTPNQLATLSCVKASGTSQSKKEIKITAVGPTLDTFLKEYGHQQSDFSSIVFKASDGYMTTLSRQFLSTHQTIILSISNGDTILSKDEKPVRLFIPGAASSNWTRMVIEITFIK